MRADAQAIVVAAYKSRFLLESRYLSDGLNWSEVERRESERLADKSAESEKQAMVDESIGIVDGNGEDCESMEEEGYRLTGTLDTDEADIFPSGIMDDENGAKIAARWRIARARARETERSESNFTRTELGGAAQRRQARRGR